MDNKKFTAYYRVSTKKQGISGLGLDAQKAIVENTAGRDNIEKEFVEIETGKRCNRKQLEAAIAHCKATGNTLIVAKVDRLGRKAGHLLDIRDNLDLVCCDLPGMNRLAFGIHAVIAEEEGRVISERTCAALAQKKARGFKLGCPENLTAKSRKNSALKRLQIARENKDNQKAYTFIKDERKAGRGYQAIAKKLNKYGYKTPRGAKFYATSVKKLIDVFERDI